MLLCINLMYLSHAVLFTIYSLLYSYTNISIYPIYIFTHTFVYYFLHCNSAYYNTIYIYIYIYIPTTLVSYDEYIIQMNSLYTIELLASFN